VAESALNQSGISGKVAARTPLVKQNSQPKAGANGILIVPSKQVWHQEDHPTPVANGSSYGDEERGGLDESNKM